MAGKTFKFNPEFTGSKTATTSWGEWVDESGNPVQQSVPGEACIVPKENVVPWFDSSAVLECPEYRREWTHSWKVEVSMETKEIDLDKLPLIKKFVSLLKGPRKFQDAEIHALWVSHIPQNITTEQIALYLEFTAAAYGAKNLMSFCRFPGYLYVHMIFYPGHSIELHGSPIPWKLRFDTSRIPLKKGYQIGDLYVRLCGNETSICSMEVERPAVMISMAPLTQQIAGIAFTTPRKPSSEMLKTYVRRGVNSMEKVKKMVKLMEAGVDVEGISLMNRLDLVLKKIPETALENYGDIRNRRIIAEKVREATTCKKKMTFGF
uniref:Protein 3 n=1 Tax=Pinus yunnanensis virus 1 TaxID=2977981 RepID=A0A9N6YJ30_9RHAB|nr:TPA_asm: protein 3 [Pinus yunnanensis virus 1]